MRSMKSVLLAFETQSLPSLNTVNHSYVTQWAFTFFNQQQTQHGLPHCWHDGYTKRLVFRQRTSYWTKDWLKIGAIKERGGKKKFFQSNKPIHPPALAKRRINYANKRRPNEDCEGKASEWMSSSRLWMDWNIQADPGKEKDDVSG